MADNLIERVLKTVRDYDMLKPDDTVLAAVSGGPDSVFLLYVLDALKRKLKMRKLAVCNLDHGLRGDESREDSLFVKRLAAKMGLKFIHKKIKLNDHRSGDLSPEELGREARYKFFRDAADKAGASVIATGHTLDDQAETVLMRFIKGASLKGIVGISPVRADGKLSVIRPLLELEKEEIKKFLHDRDISYRTDHTNLEPIYFRNVVRQEIIPFLERFNPRLKKALFNLAEHLREDFEFIETEREKNKGLALRTKEGEVVVRLIDIIVQPRALQKEVLRDSLEKAGGAVKKLSFKHWKEIENLIKYKRRGNSVDLPGSIRVTRTEKSLVFHKI